MHCYTGITDDACAATLCSFFFHITIIMRVRSTDHIIDLRNIINFVFVHSVYSTCCDHARH